MMIWLSFPSKTKGKCQSMAHTRSRSLFFHAYYHSEQSGSLTNNFLIVYKCSKYFPWQRNWPSVWCTQSICILGERERVVSLCIFAFKKYTHTQKQQLRRFWMNSFLLDGCLKCANQTGKYVEPCCESKTKTTTTTAIKNPRRQCFLFLWLCGQANVLPHISLYLCQVQRGSHLIHTHRTTEEATEFRNKKRKKKNT